MATDRFTLVFEGDIRSFKANPLKTETPFGVPIVAGVGDAFEEADDMREEIDRLRAALEIIAGSSDRLQALQARAALDNIGAKV